MNLCDLRDGSRALITFGENSEIRPLAKIEATETCVVWIFLRSDGAHLSVQGKTSDLENLHFEYRRNQPLGSIWDEARIRIARHQGYRNPEQHACYVINQPIGSRADRKAYLVETQLCESNYPRAIKNKYNGFKRLHVGASLPKSAKFFFSPRRTLEIPGAFAFEIPLGRLIAKFSDGAM